MSNEDKVPQRLWIQLTPMGGTISYIRDPRLGRDNGKPVYEYVPASALAAAESRISDITRKVEELALEVRR